MHAAWENRPKLLVIALLLSLAAHLAVLSRVNVNLRPASDLLPASRVSMTFARTPRTVSAPETPVSETQISETPRADTQRRTIPDLEAQPGRAESPPRVPREPAPTVPPLDLRFDARSEVLSQEPDSPSSSGKTVFDPQLRTRLATSRARPRSHRRSRDQVLADDSLMAGGQWQTQVRIGPKCFEIIEADPLDSLSVDQWYPVDCPE